MKTFPDKVSKIFFAGPRGARGGGLGMPPMCALFVVATLINCSGSKGNSSAPVNHRPDNAQCTEPADPGNISCSSNCPTGAEYECTRDSDCAATGTNGRCVNGGCPAGSHCTHDSCTADTDNPDHETCACHGSPYTYRAGNTCVPGNCRVDADCGTGLYCSPSAASTCGSALCLGYYCHTPQDLCIKDSDCASQPLSACVYSTSVGYWLCAPYGPPLRVGSGCAPPGGT